METPLDLTRLPTDAVGIEPFCGRGLLENQSLSDFQICIRTYSFTANTAASLLTKGRRFSGHWERHSARCSASDSFVPVEPRFKDVTASHARGSASKRGRSWIAIIVSQGQIEEFRRRAG